MVRVFFVFITWGMLAVSAFAETRLSFATPDADDDLRDALRASSLLIAAGDEANPQDLLAAAQADYGRLLGVLYENGRFGGVITIRIDGREAAAILPLRAPSAIRQIQVDVRSGPTYRFADTRVSPLPPGTELPEGFRPGAVAGTDTIRAAALTSVEAWRQDGRAKARVRDQRVTADHQRDRISAWITIDPGPRLTFGDVRITGAEDVREQRIRTIAGIPEGQVFDPDELDRVASRLRRTGSFRSVTVTENDAIGPDNTLPLSIDVVEAVPRRFGFGAEYSTTEGARLSAFWLHRNFLGGAERFRVDGAIAGIGGETGGIDLSFGARYERPATPRADVDLFAEFLWERLDEPEFTSDTTEFTLGFTRYATDTLTVEFGLGYLYADTVDSFGRETFQLLTLPLAAELDRRDDPLDATEGFYIDLEATPFLALAGTDNGTRIALDARGYRSNQALTFAGRLQLGALFGPSLAESPPFYRFFSGGGGTVRGQSYQSLGVDLGSGLTGGRSFLGLSGELRYNWNDDLQVVGFADWGYIGSESFPDFTGNSHAGAGIGVRYKTGIGPIRLDLATPISGDTPASDLYIYVGIGQAF